VADDEVMGLLKLILKASGKIGVPQGGVISPLLSNIYLTEVDRMLERAKETTQCGLRLTWRDVETGLWPCYLGTVRPDFDTSKAHFRGQPSAGAGF